MITATDDLTHGPATDPATIRHVVESSTHDLWIAAPASRETVDGLERSREVHVAPACRGVRVRLLCDTRLLEDPRAVRELQIRANAGIRIRLYDFVPQLVAISDRHLAVACDGPGTVSTSIVSGRAQVRILVDLFEAMWRGSVSAGFTCPPAQADTQRDPVLHALRSGLTDEAAARQLQVSVRTYRREVAKIMRRLGARSRFEAGFLAALADQHPR